MKIIQDQTNWKHTNILCIMEPNQTSILICISYLLNIPKNEQQFDTDIDKAR